MGREFRADCRTLLSLAQGNQLLDEKFVTRGYDLSEYQYIAFRAVDRPLSDRELAFAEKQSTRARISRWSFTNKYNFGDFRGDANGLLRHGYDVHLHYANFGVRKIALRFPEGLPFPKAVWSQYAGARTLGWKKDAKGKGGILTVSPSHEPSEIEDIWAPDEYMDDVAEIRNRLVAGDLRALYLLWLCAAYDDYLDPLDLIEPPVPGGLTELTHSAAALIEFFGLDPLMLVAASEGAPSAPARQDEEQLIAGWIDGLGNDEPKRHLRRLLVEDTTTVKAELIAMIRKSAASSDWPTVVLGRSFHELLERTEDIRAEQETKAQVKREAQAKREAAKRQRQREERMREMVKEPNKWLRKTEKLAEARGTENYEAAAEILADLREAVGGDEGDRITRQHAAHLAKEHPTLTHLKSSLRKRCLLD